MNRRPSGRNCGKRAPVGPPRVFASPPRADTRCSGVPGDGVNTITLSEFHVPPRPSLASARIRAGPPATSHRLSLPPAKKPTDALSGDQNGYAAPSEPGNGAAVVPSSERIHSLVSSCSSAAKTTLRPSGEIANENG